MIIRFWLIAGICVASRARRSSSPTSPAGLTADCRDVLVYGVAIAGEATARALAARGYDVVVADDAATTAARRSPPSSASSSSSAPDAADDRRARRRQRPRRARARRARDAPASSPPRRPPASRCAPRSTSRTSGSRSAPAGRGRCSPSPAPTARRPRRCWPSRCCEAAGRRAVDVGNTDVPLVAALDLDVDVFVVECTQLPAGLDRALPRRRRGVAQPRARTTRTGTPSMDSYEAAKARIWRPAAPDDVAIGFADDPVVMRQLGDGAGAGTARSGRRGADYHASPARTGGVLTGPARSDRRRSPRCAGRCPTTSRTRSPRRPLVLETGLAGAAGDRGRAGARSSARRTASSRSATPAACGGTTTPRRRRRTPRSPRSGRSTASC